MEKLILTINGGSSSIKFALFATGALSKPTLQGRVERIGLPGTRLTWSAATDAETGAADGKAGVQISAPDHAAAAEALLDWMAARVDLASLRAVGHRIVYGMNHDAPATIDEALLEELRRVQSYDPEHMPREIVLIETIQKRRPELKQVACFDSAFHATMPRVAKMLPLPRRFEGVGMRRYGFHGISYGYLMEALEKTAGAAAARGRVILAHLGSGASLAAVRDGQSIDTTMGFTPASGLPMGTRTGDLDPGVAWYLMRVEKIDSVRFNRLVNHESGLLGVSETSSDMRDLLARQKDDFRAAEAVELFCYHVRRWIGAFAATLGGVETLVFAGGIGENCPEIRARACEGLKFLGIEIDEAMNNKNAPIISREGGAATVRVIATDEESMIARMTSRAIPEK